MKSKSVAITAGVLAVIIVLLLSYFYIEYSNERELNSARMFLDYQVKQLNKNIEDQKLSSLALAKLIGQNDGVQDCFIKDDRQECMDKISNIVSSLNSVSMYKNIKIHLHTRDFKSYLRSWNFTRFGDDLASFRFLLKEADRIKAPVAGIENGIAGTFIRAISNVTKQGTKLGTIEVMLDFDHISGFFKEQGIDLFVLIDKNKTKIIRSIQADNLLDDYYVSNYTSTNLNVIEILKEIDFENVNFYKSRTHYFAVTPLVDMSLNRLGYYVLHINKDLKEQSLLNENFFFNSLF